MKRKERPKKQEILLVTWVDSCGDSGWKSSDDLEVHLAHCQTVGFFVKETKKAIALALNRSTKNGFAPYGEIISIPKACITSKRVLLKVKAAK